jgi:hypothetical protein
MVYKLVARIYPVFWCGYVFGVPALCMYLLWSNDAHAFYYSVVWGIIIGWGLMKAILLDSLQGSLREALIGLTGAIGFAAFVGWKVWLFALTLGVMACVLLLLYIGVRAVNWRA